MGREEEMEKQQKHSTAFSPRKKAELMKVDFPSHLLKLLFLFSGSLGVGLGAPVSFPQIIKSEILKRLHLKKDLSV